MLTLDLQMLRKDVANILQRSDLNSQIDRWLNYVQRDIAKKLKLGALRTGVETSLAPMPSPPVSDPLPFFYYDLPTDYSIGDRIYFRNTTDANHVYGWNLVPLPREFYAGDTVDIEKLMNVSDPSMSEPKHFWVEATRLGIYPALSGGLTGKLQFWYYRLPTDMVNDTDVPSIPNEFRQNMIMPAVYWGKAMIAQAGGEISVVAYWKKEYHEALKDLKVFQRQKETPREGIVLPRTGMEGADGI